MNLQFLFDKVENNNSDNSLLQLGKFEERYALPLIPLERYCGLFHSHFSEHIAIARDERYFYLKMNRRVMNTRQGTGKRVIDLGFYGRLDGQSMKMYQMPFHIVLINIF